MASCLLVFEMQLSPANPLTCYARLSCSMHPLLGPVDRLVKLWIPKVVKEYLMGPPHSLQHSWLVDPLGSTQQVTLMSLCNSLGESTCCSDLYWNPFPNKKKEKKTKKKMHTIHKYTLQVTPSLNLLEKALEQNNTRISLWEQICNSLGGIRWIYEQPLELDYPPREHPTDATLKFTQLMKSLSSLSV